MPNGLWQDDIHGWLRQTLIFFKMFSLKMSLWLLWLLWQPLFKGAMDRKGCWRQSMSKGLWQDGIHGRVRQAMIF